jgi:hypothetical protein
MPAEEVTYKVDSLGKQSELMTVPLLYPKITLRIQIMKSNAATQSAIN